MELSRQQKIAYGIIAVLALIFVVVLVYLQVLRGGERVDVPASPDASVVGLRPDVAAQGFQVEILKDQRYLELDRSLLDTGRLPVPVPGARGKPNLF